MPSTTPENNRTQISQTALSIIALIFTNLIIHARFIPRLGIYNDEWITFFTLEYFGLPQLIYLAGGEFRSLAGLVVAATSPDYTVGHILLFLTSTMTSLLIMWLFNLAFSHTRSTGLIAGVLYLILPVYFMRPHLTSLANEAGLLLVFISFALTVLAIRRQDSWRWLLFILSLLAIPAYITLYEFLIILEILRPIIIYIALRQAVSPIMRRRFTIRWSIPFIVVAELMFFYRLVIFEPYGFFSEQESSGTLGIASEVNGISGVLLRSIIDLRVGLLDGWQITLQNLPEFVTSPLQLMSAVTTALIGFAVIIYLTNAEESHNRDRRSAILLIITGVILSVLSHAAIILTGRILARYVFFFADLSRFYIVSNIGIVMIITGGLGVLKTLVSGLNGRILVASIAGFLIFTGSIAHTTYYQRHVNLWDNVRDFMWQLAEIAPDVEPDTAIIFDEELFVQPSTYIRYIAASLFYVDKSVVMIEARNVTDDTITQFEMNTDRWQHAWTPQFEDAILVYRDDTGCVRLFNPANDDTALLSGEAQSLVPFLSENPLDRVLNQPPPDTTLRDKYFRRPQTLTCG